MNSLQEFLNPVYEVGAFGLELVVYATFSAALVAVIVLAVNLLFRRWITAGQINLLWALVLVRLMLPIAPPSAFSLPGAMVKLIDGSAGVANEATTVEEWMSAPRTKTTVNEEDGKQIYSITEEPREKSSRPRDLSTAASHESIWIEDAISTVLFHFLFVWPCAAIAIILWTIFVNSRFSWKVNRTSFCRDERLATLWVACCQQARVRRTIPIVLMDAMQQPAMMGVVHHRLLLPNDAAQLSDDELRMIMLHELAHVRRWDIAMNWALVFVRAVHWWNPVYWLATSRFAATREQACDTFVVRHSAETSSRNYGELLLKLAQKMPGRSRWRIMVPTPILGYFFSAFRRRTIAARLRSLPRAAIVRGRWHTPAVAVVTVLLAYCGLTDAKTNSSADEQTPTEFTFPMVFEQTDAVEAISQSTDLPLIARDYDIGAVLSRVVGDNRTIAEARKDLDQILSHEFMPREPRALDQSVATASPPHGIDSKPGQSAAVTEWMAMPRIQPQYKKFLRPTTPATAESPAHYKLDGQQLTLTATAERHEEFAKNLRAWAQGGLATISVECRFVTMGRNSKFTTTIPWRYLAPYSSEDEGQPLPDQSHNKSALRATARVEEYIPVVYAVLDSAKAKALVEEAQQSTSTNIRQAPRINCRNGQQVSIADISQRPFVVAVRETSPGVQEPKISIATEGTKIKLRPILSADQKSIQLRSRAEFSGIGEVQEASMTSTNFPDAEPTTIQVPRVKRICIDIDSEIPNGHSLLLGSLQESRDGVRNVSNLYVLLTPSVVADVK